MVVACFSSSKEHLRTRQEPGNSPQGGSAILTAERVLANELETSVVAVDTFLGDLHVLWERPPLDRAQLLKRDGSVALFDRAWAVELSSVCGGKSMNIDEK